jgi:hypothetical protein
VKDRREGLQFTAALTGCTLDMSGLCVCFCVVCVCVCVWCVCGVCGVRVCVVCGCVCGVRVCVCGVRVCVMCVCVRCVCVRDLWRAPVNAVKRLHLQEDKEYLDQPRDGHFKKDSPAGLTCHRHGRLGAGGLGAERGRDEWCGRRGKRSPKGDKVGGK